MPDPAPSAATPAPEPSGEPGVRAGPAAPPPARRSVWTTREKLLRLAWACVRPVWIAAPGLRPWLLRRFGGRVGKNCAFAASVEVTIPWHVRCGDGVRVGERVILYGLGPITIGDGTVLDYRAHLCAGTHDMTDSRFPLLKTPITVGRGCLIGIDAYIGPNVELGDGCRVWPRASVYKSAPAGTCLRGNPARPFVPDAEVSGVAAGGAP